MYSRTNPYLAKIKERILLTKEGSTKKTYHLALDIDPEEISFEVGDSIAVVPSNDPAVVDQILNELQATGLEEVFDSKAKEMTTFRNFLLYKANIGKVSFHKILPVEKTAVSLLELVSEHKPHPSEICKVLLPLMPRFYSIASSPKVFPDEIHLTVALPSYILNGQKYFGVGSHFLCNLAQVKSTSIPIYVQPSHGFRLPDPSASIMLIGPGTGIAPFRSFLQERIATQSTGKNWLFFGERNRETDFYYSDYLLELEKMGHLQLDVAFSRDQEEKIYVQHKILEKKEAIWDWIQKGGYIYVCGDAQKMAKDVDAALQQVAHEVGGMIEEDARKYIKQLRLDKKYLLDVY